MSKSIIYIHQYFAFPDSNAGTRSYDLAKKFVEHGHSVQIITSSGYLNPKHIQRKGWNEIALDGIVVHALNLNISNSQSFSRRIFGFIIFLVRSSLKAISLKGEVVLATSTPLTIGIPALLKKMISGTPYVFEVRDVWPDVPIAMGIVKNAIFAKILFLFEKMCYNLSEHVVTLSSDMTLNLIEKGIDKNKVSTIPNISNQNRFSTNNTSDLFFFTPDDLVVLYAGTIGLVNNLSYMVELASISAKYSQRIKYVCVGKGIDAANVRSFATELGVLNKNFFMLDPVSKDELPALLSKATVCSSWVANIEELWSNSANKFFDSLAASKPIVINHKGWQSETISKFKVGYVLPQALTDDIVQDFISFLLDKETIGKYGANANLLGKDKYSLDVASSKYIEIFSKL